MKLLALSLISLRAVAGQAVEACDAACQPAFQAALQTDRSGWVSKNISNEEFYRTPANASMAKPGDLLRWEDVPRSMANTNFTAPAGMSISRFLYMSEDIDRKPIPASAFVLLPYSNPNPGKPLKTVVWTHGTAGRIRACAPSNNKDLYYEWSGVFTLALAGYAVIAPDYAGQGSDIPQGFMYEAGHLHAADVAYGLVAARKNAFMGEILSEEYVVVGHSEGGMTAWRTNERLAMPDQEELLKAGKFLGSVANSPALRPLDLIPESIRRAKGGPIGDAVSVLFLQSLERLIPNFNLKDYVTDLVLARIPLMDQGCLTVGRALFSNLTSAQLFKNDAAWLKHPGVVDWQVRYNGAGPYALAAPMLVVQGVADPLTYANNTESDFNRTCEAYPDSSATLLLYPGADHDVSAMTTQQDYFGWIADRFAGVPVEKGCRTHTMVPITNRFRSVGAFYPGIGG
ncbi:Alpha/Beta hydrolase protein [Phaeosphaeriaceae sp. PMI808]|nr:Alpha/Beta hydrolase protein [Phaeosphaeriaceae sp. PMI808]